MEIQKVRFWGTIGVCALVVLGSAGCATKKMVRQNVQSLDTKIHGVDQKVDQKTGENAQEIKDVDRRAESGIAQAQTTGENAAQAAGKADSDAQSANTLAQKGVSEAGAVQQTVEGMDNPQPVKQETVLFGFDRSTLTPKAKSDLDSLQQTISGLKYYTVDVTGYTDSTGPASYNLELSRRRADAVVRYLTENDKMPLAKIHILGYGEDTPAASNHSRSGRKQNRRVDVTILAPANEAQASTASPSAEVTPAPNSAGPQQP